jgi:hypothetical protein
MDFFSDYLIQRKEKAIIQNSIKDFEKNSGINLPPIFKSFITLFDIKKSFSSHGRISFKNKNGDIVSIIGTEYNIFSDYTLIEWYDLEKIIKLKEQFYTKGDKIWDLDVIPIGEGHFQYVILLGIGEQNKDQIFIDLNYDEAEPRITYVDENIFSYFQDFKIIEYGLNLRETKYSQLYHNWNEDFWRVREDEA